MEFWKIDFDSVIDIVNFLDQTDYSLIEQQDAEQEIEFGTKKKWEANGVFFFPTWKENYKAMQIVKLWNFDLIFPNQNKNLHALGHTRTLTIAHCFRAFLWAKKKRRKVCPIKRKHPINLYPKVRCIFRKSHSFAGKILSMIITNSMSYIHTLCVDLIMENKIYVFRIPFFFSHLLSQPAWNSHFELFVYFFHFNFTIFPYLSIGIHKSNDKIN